MAKKVLGNCPVCGRKLVVSRLSCNTCNIDITGAFEQSNFTYLEKEQLDFIETFLRCQGSLKDLQNELSISYPTAKKQLDSVLESLGYTKSQQDTEKIDILSKIASGELEVKQATEIIKKNRGNSERR